MVRLFKPTIEISYIGNSLNFNFSLQNISGRDLEIQFRSSQVYEILIIDLRGNEIFKWSTNRCFATSLINRYMKKDTKLSYNEIWDFKDNSGHQVKQGSYTVAINFLAKLKDNWVTISPDEIRTSIGIKVG